AHGAGFGPAGDMELCGSKQSSNDHQIARKTERERLRHLFGSAVRHNEDCDTKRCCDTDNWDT
ncbi:MAG: hypothetical protein KJZ78_02975, partial [Bryobacteraceae bacterium]|nr:hypothetical protein [Bryobacteraceae bacterium]